MAYGFPSATNVFIPSTDATNHLVVQFSRNIKTFRLLRYVQLTPIKKRLARYLDINAEQAARVVNTDHSEFVWHDGMDRPSGNWALESFQFKTIECLRKAFPFTMGHLTREQADWDIMASHAAIAAQTAMTDRTLDVATLVNTIGNWGSNTDTATNLGGGKWDAGTATAPYIKKSLNAASIVIHKATLGVVSPKDLVLVISPTVAAKMGESQEIHTYLKESPYALAEVRGDVEAQNAEWNLPNMLYGIPIVVEDCVRVTNLKGATKVAGYAFNSDQAVLLSRPGELRGFEGSPSFSTITQFMFEEMTVEAFDDPKNRRVEGSVVEDYVTTMTAQAAGYLIQDVLT